MTRKHPLFHAILAIKHKNNLTKLIKQSNVERIVNDDVEHMCTDVEYCIDAGNTQVKSGFHWHHAQGTNYTLSIDNHEPVLWDVPYSQKQKRKIFMRIQQRWNEQLNQKAK